MMEWDCPNITALDRFKIYYFRGFSHLDSTDTWSKMFFNQVPEGKPDPVFGLAGVFKADARSHKIDLMVGIYKDENLRSELLGSVKDAKKHLASHDIPADYIPFDGIPSFYEGLAEVIFGKTLWADLHSRTYCCQALGGTGGLRLGSEFLCQEISKTIYIPQPTWANHRQVFEKVGLYVDTYPYYNRDTKTFDCDAMCEKIATLPPKTGVLLHATCHNPTGRDPSSSQWRKIFAVMKENKLIPFFDCAYQGFGQGLEKDVEALRLCLQYCPEIVLAYSCSKNFSLYNERVGALYIITENSSSKFRVGSQVKRIIRAIYSNPPSTGARIVAEILQNSEMRKQWVLEVDAIRNRIEKTRSDFIDRLVSRSKNVDFHYLQGHLGLFMFVDLTKSQVDLLIREYGIYILDNGRISVAGLNQKNIDYVVESIIKVCE